MSAGNLFHICVAVNLEVYAKFVTNVYNILM